MSPCYLLDLGWHAVCKLFLKRSLGCLILENGYGTIHRKSHCWFGDLRLLHLLPVHIPQSLVLRVVLDLISPRTPDDSLHTELVWKTLEIDHAADFVAVGVFLPCPTGHLVSAASGILALVSQQPFRCMSPEVYSQTIVPQPCFRLPETM